MMVMKRSKYCCGAAVDTAVLFIALMDVIVGAIFFAIIFFIKDDFCYGEEEDCVNVITALQDIEDAQGLPRKPGRDKVLKNMQATYYWLLIICLVCSGIQCGMGVFVGIAVKMKSRPMCVIWLITTAVTCIFTAFLLRIFQMIVVHEFYRELEIERRLTNLSGATLGNTKRDVDPFEISKKVHPQNSPFPADIQC